MCPPLLLVLLLLPGGFDCFESVRRNSLLSSPTQANNWYSSMLVLTTTSPPTNASQNADSADQADAPVVAETRSSSIDINDELCAPDLFSNSLDEADGRNRTAIRVASNCRTSVHKPDSPKPYGQKFKQPTNSHQNSQFSGRTNLTNLTNNFISPQSVHLKTSPNGEITVINGKSVTPILYAHDRPLVLPQYERLMAPAKNYIVTKTSTVNEVAAASENKPEHAEGADGEEGEEGDGEGEEEEEEKSGTANGADKEDKGEEKGGAEETKGDADSAKDAQANQYVTPTSTTSSTSTTSLPPSSTARPNKYRFPTRRPDYFSKAKYGDKLGKEASNTPKPATPARPDITRTITTRRPVPLASSTTTSPRYTPAVPPKMNAQIEALRNRYKQQNKAGGGRTAANEPPAVKPTAVPNKVTVEYTTTTTTTTESLLKYELEHEYDPKKAKKVEGEGNGGKPSMTQYSYSGNESKNGAEKATDDSSAGYNAVSPTDTTKKQIPQPNNVPPYQMASSTTTSTARPRVNPWRRPSTPRYRIVQPSPSPPYSMKISVPENAYYTPLPSADLKRLNHHAPTNDPVTSSFVPISPSPYPSRHAVPAPSREPPQVLSPPPPPKDSQEQSKESNEYGSQQYFVQGNPGESYSHEGPTPTPSPEVFVTIENQFYLLRNQTPIISKEIALPPTSVVEANHYHEPQKSNKFSNDIVDMPYGGRNKPYKGHQQQLAGHAPPLPPPPSESKYPSISLGNVPMANSAHPAGTHTTLNGHPATANPAEMFIYYEQNNQPKYNYRLVHSHGDQASSSSVSPTATSSSFFDKYPMSPDFTRQLQAFADIDESLLTSSRAIFSPHKSKIEVQPPRTTMTLSMQPLISPSAAEPPSSPTSMPPKMNMYKPIEINANTVSPIVYGQSFHSGQHSAPTNSPPPHKQSHYQITQSRPSSSGESGPSAASLDSGGPFTVVRHFVRTYAYNDNQPRPSTIEFDSKLNVALNDVQPIPSLTSNYLRPMSATPTQQYFGMPRPSSASMLSDDHKSSMRYQSRPSESTYSSLKPTQQAIVLKLNLPTGSTNQPMTAEQYRLNLDEMSMLTNLNRPHPSQATMTHFASTQQQSRPTPTSDFSSLLMSHSDGYPRANIVPVETTIYESEPLRTGKLMFNNGLDKPPMLTMDSTVHSTKQPFSSYKAHLRANRFLSNKPMELDIPMEELMSALDRRPTGAMLRPGQEFDIMDEGGAESQVHQMLKPTKDPFEEYYSDRLLPVNSMIDYSGIMWEGDGDNNRVNLLHPNDTRSGRPASSSSEVKYTSNEARPTVKSKLKDLLAIFNEAKANNQSQSQSQPQPTAQAVLMAAMPCEGPQCSSSEKMTRVPMYEKVQLRPNYPTSSTGLLSQLASARPTSSKEVEQPSMSLPATQEVRPQKQQPLLLWHLKSPSALAELPTVSSIQDGRFSRNQRILSNLKTIFGLATPHSYSQQAQSRATEAQH